MEVIYARIRDFPTEKIMKINLFVGGGTFLSTVICAYLGLPQSVVIPLAILTFLTLGVLFILGAIRQEFFQYTIIRGRTAMILNIFMVVFCWGLAIALLISWIAKQ